MSRVCRSSALAVGAAALALPLLTAAPAGAAEQVPARNGTYGAMFGTDMLLFKVRNRTIIDPRFTIPLTCRHNDGTTSEVIYGPTSSDPSRRFRIPRDADGRLSWTQEFDSSLIRNAQIEITYGWTRPGRAIATVWVNSHDEDVNEDGSLWTSDCEGIMPFRLQRGPLRPDLPR